MCRRDGGFSIRGLYGSLPIIRVVGYIITRRYFKSIWRDVRGHSNVPFNGDGIDGRNGAGGRFAPIEYPPEGFTVRDGH